MTAPLTIRRLPLPEFVALMALISAVVAFSIDSMLPALGDIAADLSPDSPNSAQLVLSAFMLGMGFGTFFAGPLADALGRKRVVTLGFAVYAIAAFAAIFADELETLLALRFVMGLGAAAPRIATMALVRDLYQGREMARITSFVSMVFILIPAVAPMLGSLVISVFGWHGVFGSFVLLALIGACWFNLRQPETLPPAQRRPIRLGAVWAGLVEVLSNAQVRRITLVLALGFGQMFILLNTAQQLFSETYGRGETFPYWFAVIALMAGCASLLNARLVMRLGMRRIAGAAYGMQVVISGVMVPLVYGGLIPDVLAFPLFIFWTMSVFAMAGVTFGNLTALALHQMGHIAGTTASVVSGISTFIAVGIAAPVGQLYDGSLVPMVTATLICSALAVWLLRGVREA